MAKSKKPDNSCMSDKEMKLLDGLIEDKIQNSALSAEELTDLTDMKTNAAACIISSAPSAKGVKKKRKPSAYNIFIGDCMRGGGKDMKACSVEYKAKKKAGEV